MENLKSTNPPILLFVMATASLNFGYSHSSDIPIPKQIHKIAEIKDDFLSDNSRWIPKITPESILYSFLSSFLNETKDIENKYAQIIEENFWSLIENE